MTIPRRIKILGRTYKVKMADLGSEYGHPNAWGISQHEDQEVILQSDLPHEIERSTMWHEVLHAVTFTQFRSLPEEAVEAISYGEFRVMRDNPKLMQYLLS